MYRIPTQRPHPLFAHLNGWRRIGVVLVFAWMVTGGGVLWRTPEVVAEAFPALAESVMGTRSIPAPELKEELEAAKMKQLGRALKPWEMEWSPMREVPIRLPAQVPPITRWLLLFAVPLLTWQLVELLVCVALWVRAGFARSPGR
jgi:hypothetical protein